jgi:hypothetical protein
LKEASCECYQAVNRQYNKLLYDDWGYGSYRSIASLGLRVADSEQQGNFRTARHFYFVDYSKGVIVDHSDRCRIQADECNRLMLLSQSGAEATILTSLTRSWKMIANQTDRYVAIMKKEAAQKK